MVRSRWSHESNLASAINFDANWRSYVMIQKTGNVMRKTLVAMIATAMLAIAIAPAMAGAQTTSPTCEQYSSNSGTLGGGGSNGPTIGGTQCNQVDPGGGGGSSNTSSGLSSRVGGLPFTGFDVLSMAAVALAVTGLGLILQRAVSRPREEL